MAVGRDGLRVLVVLEVAVGEIVEGRRLETGLRGLRSAQELIGGLFKARQGKQGIAAIEVGARIAWQLGHRLVVVDKRLLGLAVLHAGIAAFARTVVAFNGIPRAEEGHEKRQQQGSLRAVGYRFALLLARAFAFAQADLDEQEQQSRQKQILENLVVLLDQTGVAFCALETGQGGLDGFHAEVLGVGAQVAAAGLGRDLGQQILIEARGDVLAVAILDVPRSLIAFLLLRHELA